MRHEKLHIINYLDLDGATGGEELKCLEVTDNPVLSILVADENNQDVLFEYSLTSIIDEKTDEIIATLDLSEKDNGK